VIAEKYFLKVVAEFVMVVIIATAATTKQLTVVLN